MEDRPMIVSKRLTYGLTHPKQTLKYVWRNTIAAAIHRIAQVCYPDECGEFLPLPTRPYAYMQMCVEKQLARYIPGVAQHRGPIRIAIVGACTAPEVQRMIKFNPD